MVHKVKKKEIVWEKEITENLFQTKKVPQILYRWARILNPIVQHIPGQLEQYGN